MKKQSKFLIGFGVAALTFGTLMATLGPEKFGRHCSSHWRNHHGYSHCGHTCSAEAGHACQPVGQGFEKAN